LALKTSCPCCGKLFSAPEEYAGKKTNCPKCDHRFVLKTEEQALQEAAELEAKKLQQLEDRRRIDLIERQEKKNLDRQAAMPYYERFQTGTQPVRNYDPRSGPGFLSLRYLADLLLIGAYAALLLSLTGVGLTVYLQVTGEIGSIVILSLILIGWVLVGGILFLLLKYLAELALLLASLGDQQNDVVRLLLDLRVNTEKNPTEES
tara:strand:- start:1059 stop:1673 length:615 start_codon:yes stop_codon:yes gene_type:complete